MCNTQTSNTLWEQLSLFSMPAVVKPVAINLYDNTKYPPTAPKEWMNALVPDGEYVIMVGNHPCVLRRTEMAPNRIPEGHTFYHFLVDNIVYSGVFVG